MSLIIKKDMKIFLSLLLFLVAGLSVCSHAGADTIICPDIADVYIDQESPITNFNDKTRLLISYPPYQRDSTIGFEIRHHF